MTNASDKSRKALGKGLSALLPGRQGHASAGTGDTSSHPVTGTAQVPVDLIDPNPSQPRNHFQHDRLEELAQSIRANGIIQPLIVRRSGDRFELIAGERRWRAARIAALERVPVVIQEIAEEDWGFAGMLTDEWKRVSTTQNKAGHESTEEAEDQEP